MRDSQRDMVIASIIKPRRRWWRFFLQFSLRTLLIVMTLAAVGCWWFLQPQVRDEEVAGRHLKLRRQVRVEKQPVAIQYGNPRPQYIGIDGALLINVGRWRLRGEHDDLLVAGRYENDQPHGKWTVYHVNGRKAAEGEVVKGARSGLWRTWNEEGEQESEVTYKARKPRKPGRFRKPIDPAFVPTPSWETIRHGPVRVWHAGGRLKFEGSYQEDRRAELWTFYDEQGRMTARGQYRDDKREGKWTVLDPVSGQQSQVDYVGGRPRDDHERLIVRLQQQLTSGQIARQVAAAEQLLKLGEHGVPTLVAALDEPGDNVKLVALSTLERVSGLRLTDGTLLNALPAEALQKIEPLVESPDKRVANNAMLLVYRHRAERREALFPKLLQATRKSSSYKQYQVLATIYSVDPGRRAAVISEMALLSAQHRSEGRTSRPYDFVGLAAGLGDDLPPALIAAAHSDDPIVRQFVLDVIGRLALDERPVEVINLPSGGSEVRCPVPPPYRELVERAKADPHADVRKAAERVGLASRPRGGSGNQVGGFF
jgi:antitoxin component YwqK of YwqJK toxin-antitoxin module